MLDRQLPGKAVSAGKVNQGIDAREILENIQVAAPLEIARGKMSLTIRLAASYVGKSWAKTGGGGIPARSGATLGSATVTRYLNIGGTLTATSGTVTAYNGSKNAVGGNEYIQLIFSSGNWEVFWEDCP